MKLKKSLFLGLCSFILMTQLIYATDEMSKDGYKIITLEEFKKLETEKVPKKIIIQDYYDNGQSFREYYKINYEKIEKKYPNLYERIYHYPWEKEITLCTVKAKREYNFTDSKTYISIIEIENLRSLEELENKIQAMQQRIDKVKELSLLKIEEIKKSTDQQGAAIAKEYTYHGFNESERNVKLLINKALEQENAYYIPNFSINGSYAEIIVGFNINTWSTETKLIAVDYQNQNLKSKIVDSGKTDVIIVGGKYLPTVIGTFNERIESLIYYYEQAENFKIDKTSVYNFYDFFDLKKFEQYEKNLGINQEL